MIIALSIDENNFDSELSEVFGRSKFLLFLNSEDKSKKIICNPFASSFGGAGIQTSQILIENNCDVLITKSIGEHAYSFLKSVDIKVFISKEDNVLKTMELYERGLLELVDEKVLSHYKGHKRFRKRHRGRNNY